MFNLDPTLTLRITPMNRAVPPMLRAHAVLGHDAYQACSPLAIFIASSYSGLSLL